MAAYLSSYFKWLLIKSSYFEKNNCFEKNDCFEKGAPQKSNCCVEVVTLKKCEEVPSPKIKREEVPSPKIKLS